MHFVSYYYYKWLMRLVTNKYEIVRVCNVCAFEHMGLSRRTHSRTHSVQHKSARADEEE